jgi:hypothetical protein
MIPGKMYLVIDGFADVGRIQESKNVGSLVGHDKKMVVPLKTP